MQTRTDCSKVEVRSREAMRAINQHQRTARLACRNKHVQREQQRLIRRYVIQHHQLAIVWYQA
jgi:hypothetical protein